MKMLSHENINLETQPITVNACEKVRVVIMKGKDIIYSHKISPNLGEAFEFNLEIKKKRFFEEEI